MNGGSEAAADADGGVVQIGGVEGLYMPQRHVVVGDDEMGGEFAPCGEVEADAEGAVEIGLRFIVHNAVERHACPQVEETELRLAAERGAEHHVDGIASAAVVDHGVDAGTCAEEVQPGTLVAEIGMEVDGGHVVAGDVDRTAAVDAPCEVSESGFLDEPRLGGDFGVGDDEQHGV